MMDTRSPLTRLIYRGISRNVTGYFTYRLASDESVIKSSWNDAPVTLITSSHSTIGLVASTKSYRPG
jgi:hypothetical protein